ncbi:hypothetical protein A3715_08645 [Oleiphilus sp. HI0009]|uniref:fasciclin domain-containing protein n=5 Tax=unclassified Oleiphilus TaxID=2631174 RepID=UPI0007C29E2D|nr:fasciclin domain-containing protein [Oleiphilus sp. HI0066]KZX79431.1 hypothetical protein A3715_08645 [Oleiphilus sp. HI0009]KZY63028.1 hypothetical protein A3738_02255 [Oleiphilus sp. HI0066]
MSMISFGTNVKRWAPLMILGAIPFISACSDSDDSPAATPSITDIASSTPNFSSLATAVTDAGLAGTLDDDSAELTVFAPNNDAFTALLDSNMSWDELSDIPLSTLYSVLKYHVVGSEINAEAAVAAAGGSVTSLLGEDIDVSLSGDDLFVENAQVIDTDINASNGIIHEIDAVMVPMTLPTENIATLAGTAGLASLVAAVGSAEMSVADALTDADATLTVFAPTDAAFADFLSANGFADVDAIPDDLLTRVLNYHVVPGFVPSEAATSLVSGGMPMADTALTDTQISLSLTGSTLYVNNAAVTSANNLATNGVVHVIDKVLLPPELAIDTSDETDSIAAIVTAAAGASMNADLTTLLAAVTAADLAGTLSGAGTFTVFAPTDAAFAAAGFDENNIGAVEGLQDILLQHVLGSEVSALAAYAANGSDVATLREGSSVSVEISNGDLLIEGAKVIETDIKASNGTIHLIDSVILSTN